ncbi:zinc ribbon domain-containing protein [Ahniella affigens]|nr:zinc ribbon domain-containing protein [Ahniella affigens]
MSTQHCPSCGSCGFPMQATADFAGGNPNAAFCSTCADANGALKPFDEVLALNADYLAREQRIEPAAAQAMARALLLASPVWQKQGLHH